jgi:citrate lyase subunit beta/citryl-CoA lyase
MRSLLFVPGHSSKMMAKAAGSGADILVLDLEDAVQPDSKLAARKVVIDALNNRAATSLSLYVRVNALNTTWCADDVAAVMPARPDGIMLPKPNGPEDLDRLADMMARHEHTERRGQTRIIPVCTETADATLSLAAKPWARPRLAGMLWGGEDLSAAIGATANRDADGHYTQPFALARSLCLLAARAADVVPIDAVFTDFRNSAALEHEVNAARRDGFSAKAAIHPSQVNIINRGFTPTEAELVWAERVLAAFECSFAGAVQIDGMMLDAPHRAQAQRILASIKKDS